MNSFKEVNENVVDNFVSVVQRIPFLEILGDGTTSKSLIENSEEEEIEGTGSGGGGHLFRMGSTQRKGSELTPHSTVRLIHQSANEYVLKHCDKFRESVESVDGFGLPRLNDAAICELCITFLKFREFKTGGIRTRLSGYATFSEGLQEYIDSFDLLDYVSVFWSYHLQKVPNALVNSSKTLLEYACSFLCDSPGNLEAWL